MLRERRPPATILFVTFNSNAGRTEISSSARTTFSLLFILMKKVILSCARALLNFLYAFFKLLPVRHKVVMISRQSNQPSLDFRLLKYHLKKEDPNLEVIMLCRTLDGKLDAGIGCLIRYGFHMIRQMYHIATSKVVVLDSYCIVVSLLHHRKDLQIIQMWHSMGTMKKFGYTALDTPEGVSSESAHLLHMHENYTCVLASSPAYAGDLAAGFGCSRNIIRTMPLPRTDLLRSRKYQEKKQAEILSACPQLKGKTVILYCPTFRQDETELKDAILRLAGLLDPEKEILLLNLHPLSKISVSAPHMVSGTPFSSFELLCAADAFITDYSCMLYEAAFKGIPVYFYDFDFNDYTVQRGLAIDYEKEIPGPAAKDPQALLNMVRAGSCDMDRLEAFSDQYIRYSGHAGRDIAEYILSFC